VLSTHVEHDCQKGAFAVKDVFHQGTSAGSVHTQITVGLRQRKPARMVHKAPRPEVEALLTAAESKTG
jgi:hypothetical protein